MLWARWVGLIDCPLWAAEGHRREGEPDPQLCPLVGRSVLTDSARAAGAGVATWMWSWFNPSRVWGSPAVSALIETDRARGPVNPKQVQTSAGDGVRHAGHGRALMVEMAHCVVDIAMLDSPLYDMPWLMVTGGMGSTTEMQTWRSRPRPPRQTSIRLLGI